MSGSPQVLNDSTIEKIDAAVKAAKERAKAKAAAVSEAGAAPAATPSGDKLTAEQKAEARLAQKAHRDQERAARAAKREQDRAERQAQARSRSESPAHMRKVEKAASKLSPLSEAANLLLTEARSSLTPAELSALAGHILHHNRVEATARSAQSKLEAGQAVTIIGGDPRYVGKEGILHKAQRIRCYVTVPGIDKHIYLFTSDVKLNAVQPEKPTAAAAEPVDPPAAEPQDATSDGPTEPVADADQA